MQRNIRIRSDICSHHEEHVNFHNKLHQRIFQAFLIVHMHAVGEVCCPPHQSQSFEAMGDAINRTFKLETERGIHQKHMKGKGLC